MCATLNKESCHLRFSSDDIACKILLFTYFNDIKHKPVFTSSMVLIYCMGAYWLQHQIKGYFKSVTVQ